jgi:hypothetical protein
MAVKKTYSWLENRRHYKMMLNLFGKKQNPQDILLEAKNKLSEGNLKQALDIAGRLSEDEDEEIKCEAKHIMGLSHFKLENYQFSQGLFEYVAAIRNDANSWLNVITSSILAGNFAKGQTAFEKAFECQKQSGYSQQPSLPFIRYYYAYALHDANKFEKSLEQLDELKKIYIKLIITDDTFLYMRGVPFLSQTLDLAEKVFQGMKKDFYSSEWLHELEQSVDDDGKDYIKRLRAREEK